MSEQYNSHLADEVVSGHKDDRSNQEKEDYQSRNVEIARSESDENIDLSEQNNAMGVDKDSSTCEVINRNKLSSLFEEIIKNTAIDYNNQEIKDIQEAVWQMLASVKNKINADGHFKISRIEPCGSMAEKSSIWKMYPPNHSFFEFDFLAVLEKRSDCRIVQGCSGCMKVESLPCDADEIVRQRYNDRKYDQVGLSDLESDFHKTVGDLMFRCACGSCDCLIRQKPRKFSARGDNDGHHRRIWFKIEKPTGKLLASNWQTWKWKSYAKGLSAPNAGSPKQTIRVSELGIYIDFVPAIELDRGRFMVAKPCTKCFHGWRISGCMAEINRFLCMSDSHRNCYRVLKYLYQFKEVYGQNYILKTAVLNHITMCNRPHTPNNCTKCVLEILFDLQNAYRYQTMKAYGRETDLLQGLEAESGWSEKGNRLLISSLLKFDSWETLKSQLGVNNCCSSVSHLEWYIMIDPDIDSGDEISVGPGTTITSPTGTRKSEAWCILC